VRCKRQEHTVSMTEVDTRPERSKSVMSHLETEARSEDATNWDVLAVDVVAACVVALLVVMPGTR
jgi:hypothetical protein